MTHKAPSSGLRPPSPKGRRELQKAVKILKHGGVVVYPTDTSYGLAVDATNLAAVKKLYKLKGRDFHKPIHVIFPKHLHTVPYASGVVRIDQRAKKLIKKFWPGALTLVLPLKAKAKSFQMLSAGTKSLGVRLPNNKMALALVKAFKKPITTTSANVSGLPNTYSIKEVKKQFAEKSIYLSIYSSTYFLDGGKLKQTKPSTVVLLTGRRVKILRQGPISETEIKKVLKSNV